jgi:ABC-type cobalamin/Fe3+-siderophores transport system ATPase subunit
MKFYNYPRNTYIQSIISSLELPCVILISDNWDDFGYKTFHLAYFIDEDKSKLDLGAIRILDKNSNITSLQKEFAQLGEQYCSLAASMDYYELLGNLGRDIYEEIFSGLNDVAYYEEIRGKFSFLEGFNESLLRDGSSRNALSHARDMLDNLKLKTVYNFSYITQVEGASEPHNMKFDFEDNNSLPFRVITIIGKNGTGKTAVLSNLAADLTEEYKKDQEKFHPKKPEFGKLITISYSVFGGFETKKKSVEDEVTYQNFGVLNDENIFSKELMTENVKNSVVRIIEFKRTDRWIEILSEFSSKEFVNFIKLRIIDKEDFEVLSKLSSGQRMIFEIITNIVGNIRKNSLIIFDEPEIHLHPNAIALLMKALYFVLEEYESFAIIATHVPQVIQQVPAKSVIVFERQDRIPIVRELEIESFGENLTTITNEIFETMNVFDNYKIILKNLSNSMTYEEVNILFLNKLPLNAKIFLKSLY